MGIEDFLGRIYNIVFCAAHTGTMLAILLLVLERSLQSADFDPPVMERIDTLLKLDLTTFMSL